MVSSARTGEATANATSATRTESAKKAAAPCGRVADLCDRFLLIFSLGYRFPPALPSRRRRRLGRRLPEEARARKALRGEGGPRSLSPPLPAMLGEALMSNTSSKPIAPSPTAGPPPVGAAVQLKGGAAILAPVSAFPNGVPGNALILLPINANGTPLETKIVDGPVALQMDEVWKLLGFNGPAVQVQDEQGRPIAIGLEDLLGGLEKHWNDAPEDMGRGRIFAQELIKHGRHAKAETVLSKIVALGGDGEDWLGLGVAQLAQKKVEKGEGTLKGAQNLMKDNPFPSLHLAKVYKAKGDKKAEREAIERALSIEPGSVDAWAYLTTYLKETDGEDKAVQQIE